MIAGESVANRGEPVNQEQEVLSERRDTVRKENQEQEVLLACRNAVRQENQE